MSTPSTSSGWNRSTSTTKPAPKKPSAMRGVVAGLVVVALAAACIVVFMGKGEKPVEKAAKKPTKIKEVTPAVVKAQEQPREETPEEKERRRREAGGCYTNKNGYIINAPHTPRVSTNDTAMLPRTLSQRIFTNRADRKIGMLLEIRPGAPIVGTLPKHYFGETFVNNFLESLKEPIIVSRDEPANVQALKRAVIEAKIELKARYDAGEDIGKILENERKELKNLWLYRDELRKEVAKLSRNDPNLSDEEIADFVKAANTMLESRGALPLAMPKTAIRKMMAEDVHEESKTSSKKTKEQ